MSTTSSLGFNVYKMSRTLRIRILYDTDIPIENNVYQRHHVAKEQFFSMFIPSIYNYTIVGENEPADICIAGNYLSDNSRLRDDEVNILLSLENNAKWEIYSHQKKYGDYGDHKIDVYLYNHKSVLTMSDTRLTIPLVYSRIRYFIEVYGTINFNKTPFSEKLDCLYTNRSGLNKDTLGFSNEMSKICKVDNIALYNDLIYDKSCYNSPEFLSVLSKYKFVICNENSYNNGYITEKIFNCFLAGTIPIYCGAPDIDDFIDPNCYINAKNIDLQLVERLKDNEEEYSDFVYRKKISSRYHDHDFVNKMHEFIERRLESKKSL